MVSTLNPVRFFYSRHGCYLLAKDPCPLGIAEYCEDNKLMKIFPILYNYLNKQTLLNICMNSFPVYSVENS